MKKKTLLNEVIKINVEIDPRDIEGMHSEPEMGPPEPRKSSRIQVDGGKFEQYVRELAHGARVHSTLIEAAREVNAMVEDTLEDVALREDRRESNVAQSHAMGKVLREWRSFLRELGAFDRRFNK